MRSSSKSIMFIISLVILAILLLYPEVYEETLKKTAVYSIKTVVPTLFPFMVLSGILCELEVPTFLKKLLSPVTKAVGIPEEASCALLVGNICGFPIGAAIVEKMAERHAVSKKEALRTLICSNNVSLSFAVSFVGAHLFFSRTAGLLLWISCILSSFIITAILRFFKKDSASTHNDLTSIQNVKSAKAFSDIFTSSVKQAIDASLSVVAFISVFSVISALISYLCEWLNVKNIYIFISSLLEVSTACKLLSTLPFPKSFSMSAFALSFSGMSVIFQSMLLLKKSGVKCWEFMLFKFLQGILSAVIALFVSQIFELSLPAFAPDGAPFHSEAFIFFSLCMLALFIIIKLKELRHTT